MNESEAVRVLVPGEARGTLLRIRSPISFWGGVDPTTGQVSDPRHPNHGDEISGRILVVPATAGSSSSSAIMLELLRNGIAPAALIIARHDGILVLGVLVARELGYDTIPVLEVSTEFAESLPEGVEATIGPTDAITLV